MFSYPSFQDSEITVKGVFINGKYSSEVVATSKKMIYIFWPQSLAR